MSASGFHKQSYLRPSAFGTDTRLKGCPHRGGPVHSIPLGHETLALLSPVFCLELHSRREGIVFLFFFLNLLEILSSVEMSIKQVFHHLINLGGFICAITL